MTIPDRPPRPSLVDGLLEGGASILRAVGATLLVAGPVALAWLWYPRPVTLGVVFATLAMSAAGLGTLGFLQLGWSHSSERLGRRMILAGVAINLFVGGVLWWNGRHWEWRSEYILVLAARPCSGSV